MIEQIIQTRFRLVSLTWQPVQASSLGRRGLAWATLQYWQFGLQHPFKTLHVVITYCRKDLRILLKDAFKVWLPPLGIDPGPFHPSHYPTLPPWAVAHLDVVEVYVQGPEGLGEGRVSSGNPAQPLCGVGLHGVICVRSAAHWAVELAHRPQGQTPDLRHTQPGES